MVAVSLFWMEPEETSRPAEEERPTAERPEEKVEEPVVLVTLRAPARVLVALDVFWMEPPVTIRPAEAEREVAPIPPSNVEVALEVLRMEPAVMTRP